ncbi:hypothetical protein ACQP2E_20855 [Actinoplanes sp. CA-015351]|uniref:hypothetical protein n=1 Tax=Actinoplanes sp. CA-015351 TaxID=3239897 RepID=UPI003D994609
MRYRVSLRFNSRTGEMETFVVEAVDANTHRPEHDAEHVRAANAVGRLLDPHPGVQPVAPDRIGSTVNRTGLRPPADEESETGRNRVTE